jgi:LDH2 family malate/lactate/ureidoglycolate dehydrogenase
MTTTRLIDHDRLREAVVAIFRAAGSSEREAGLIAGQLVESNLRAAFAAEMEAVLGWVQSENGDGGGRVKLPGMPELETRAVRLLEGVPLDAATLDQIMAAARVAGVTALDLA